MDGPDSVIIWKGASRPAKDHRNEIDFENAQARHSTGTQNQSIFSCKRKEYRSDDYNSNAKPCLDHPDAANGLTDHPQLVTATLDYHGQKIKTADPHFQNQATGIQTVTKQANIF